MLYFSDAVQIVFEHHSLLDKFYGDGLMVIYGPAGVRNDDASRALAAVAALHQNAATIEVDCKPLGLAVRRSGRNDSLCFAPFAPGRHRDVARKHETMLRRYRTSNGQRGLVEREKLDSQDVVRAVEVHVDVVAKALCARDALARYKPAVAYVPRLDFTIDPHPNRLMHAAPLLLHDGDDDGASPVRDDVEEPPISGIPIVLGTIPHGRRIRPAHGRDEHRLDIRRAERALDHGVPGMEGVCHPPLRHVNAPPSPSQRKQCHASPHPITVP
jgi:hypothetical protein